MVEFCDLLGTPYAPVSKIPSVKVTLKYESAQIKVFSRLLVATEVPYCCN